MTLYRIKGTFSETETTTTGEIYYTTDIFYTTTLLYYIILCSGVIYIYIYTNNYYSVLHCTKIHCQFKELNPPLFEVYVQA